MGPDSCDPVGRFVAGLAAALLPAGAAAGVTAALEVLRDDAPPARARKSPLTGRGVPFEASVSGPEREPSLRYVVEAGAGRTFFGPRLARQRDVATQLAGHLPDPAAAVAAREVEAFFAAYAPDPGAVRARSEATTFVGLVHDPSRAEHLARFKLYGHLAVDSAAYARMAEAWPGVAAATSELIDLDYLVPSMAAADVDADGRVVRKLYSRTVRALDRREAAALVQASGGDEHGVLREAAALGLERFWARRLFVCRSVDQGGRVATAMHATALAAGRGPEQVEPVVRALARRFHGDEALVDALAAAGDGCGVPWSFTVIGLGLGAGAAGSPKLNVYAAPDRLD